MGQTIAGTEVDASYMRSIVERGQKDHGDRFDTSDLEAASHFAPYLRNGSRLKVRRTFHNGEVHERTGTVGKTTGWRPAFLLMHRSNAHGSWDVLGADDEIVAFWNGRRYIDVP